MKRVLLLVLVANAALAESLRPPPPRLVPDSGEVPLDAHFFVAANEPLEIFDSEHQPVPFEREGAVGTLAVHARDGQAYTIRFLDPDGHVRLDWPRAPLEFHFVAKAGWKPPGKTPVIGAPRRRDWGFTSHVDFDFEGGSPAYRFIAENAVSKKSWKASPQGSLRVSWPLFGDERADRAVTRIQAVGLELDGSTSPASAWVEVRPPLEPASAPWGLVFLDQLTHHRRLAALLLGASIVLIALWLRRASRR